MGSSTRHQPSGGMTRTFFLCFSIVTMVVSMVVLIVTLGPSVGSDSYEEPWEKNAQFPTLTPVSSSDGHSSSTPISYQNWLDTTITLQDGIQYEIVNQISHDPNAFTQGLTYANGVLYESTGLRGKSSIRTLNSITGQVKRIISMDASYFGEGMTVIGNSGFGGANNYDNPILVQITWTSKTGFIYNATHFSSGMEINQFVLKEFDFRTTTGEGWGITYNPNTNELIVSDGSNMLHFWNLNDLRIQEASRVTISSRRTLSVTRQNGLPATRLNELEFWRGRILANVWYEDVILVIHPDTGVVEKEYDMASLWPYRGSTKNVLNGISISAHPDILYVTGKRWDRIFQLKLLPL